MNDSDVSQLKGTVVDLDSLQPKYVKAEERLAAESEAKARELARKFAEGEAASAAGAGARPKASDAATADTADAASTATARQATRRAEPAPAPAPAAQGAPPSSSSPSNDAAAAAAAAAAKLKGNAAFAAKNFPAAVAHYTLGLASDVENAVLHSNRAAALSALGLYREALRDADNAVRLDPAWSKGHLRRGSILAALGRHEEAVKSFKTAIHFDVSAAATTHDALSAAEAKSAAAAAGAAWDPDPSPVAASAADALDAKARGNAAFSSGDYVAAVEHYVAGISAAPENAVLHSNRAAALLGMKAFADAEMCARSCVKLDPSFAKGYGRLAEALRLSGKRMEARRVLEEGLDRCQGNAALREALDAL